MRAGRLTEVIVIERASFVVNAAGTPVETWTPIVTLRAEKIEQTTTEFIRNFGSNVESLMIFRARFTDGITIADRVKWNGQAFTIREVSPIGRRKGLEIRCIAISETEAGP